MHIKIYIRNEFIEQQAVGAGCIPALFSQYPEIIMQKAIEPNHMHSILILNDDTVVETLHATSLQQPEQSQQKQSKNEFMASIFPKSNSVSSIMRSYKSSVIRHANCLGWDFAWQVRFYDYF